MFIEEALRTHLAANTALAALVSTRIHPGIMPQNGALPALVYQKVSSVPEYAHDGPVGLAESRFQISVMAASYGAAKAVAKAVKKAMQPLERQPTTLSGILVAGAFLENEVDVPEFNDVDQLSRFHIPMDWVIQHDDDRDI